MRLEVKDGTFAYKGGKNVLKKVDFSAENGDLLAVLGPNGAGKTTLLRCVMGFLKWNSGISEIDGKNIAHMSHRELFSRVAYVPQARSVFSSSTALEMVLLGRASRLGMLARPGKEDVEAAEEVMKKLGILSLSDKKCTEVSGGELQMILIARALAAESGILILDEPESNLDFKNQLIVLDVISGLAASGMICVFNTHYPAHALQRAGKSLMLSSDGSYMFGETASVVTEENIEKAFGVRAVIGEVETPVNTMKSVIPVELRSCEAKMRRREPSSERRIAVVSVISSSFEAGESINAILHDCREYLIGRMGMPYQECGLYIINATLDAPENVVSGVVERLGRLGGVSVKATYARGDFDKEDV